MNAHSDSNPHATDAGHAALPVAPQPARKTLFAVAAAFVIICLGAFSVAYASQRKARAALVAETNEQNAQVLRVVVTRPTVPGSARKLDLPGSVDALRTTIIDARTSGYLKSMLVDIGDKVKEGQLLAVIDSPEVEAQYEQAKAALAQAKAAREQARTNLEFARISLERTKPLVGGVASQQDLDQRQAEHQAALANLDAADANIAANVANVRRLSELKTFTHVVAPFAGTITERSTEIGSLITAGNGTGQALFKMAQSNPVRVWASVPQSLATDIHRGMSAIVTVREYPGRSFIGKVTRDAGALDLASRTLLTEVQVPNADGALLQGMYAQVSFSVESTRKTLMLDSAALSITANGARVAVVRDGKIHLQPISIEADLGSTLAVADGINADDRVVLNPDSRLVDGLAVEVVEPGAAPMVKSR